MKTLRLAAGCALSMALLVPTLASATGDPTGTTTNLLPDIRVAKLYQFSLETRPNGRVRLHFGTIGWNVGDGPLEVRGRKVDPNDRYMRVTQRIYHAGGGYHNRVTPAVMIYEVGDHHDHWHIRQFMVVNMYTVGDPNGNVYGLRKIGYCLLDAARMPIPPPNAPPDPVYPLGACGSQDRLTITMGLSVGYGDDYPPNFAHQWMDVTDIASGNYRICTTADPLEEFREKDETNNQRWTDVHIDMATKTVNVLATGIAPCGPGIS